MVLSETAFADQVATDTAEPVATDTVKAENSSQVFDETDVETGDGFAYAASDSLKAWEI